MNERDIQVIVRLRKHTSAIVEYTKNCSEKKEFLSNPMLVDACVFNLMQIGELAKQQLSEEAKESIKNIPWKQLYGMRNRIVHGYDGVNMNIVWATVKEDIPKLDGSLKEIIETF